MINWIFNFIKYDFVIYSGELYLSQKDENSPLIINGVVYNIDPDESLHGFHIHQNGDLTDNCKAAGPHFNPNGVSQLS